MKYKVSLTKKAHKDLRKLKEANLLDKAKELLFLLAENPFSAFPPYEKLSGDLNGFYSRRLSVQHRLVYSVNIEKLEVKVSRMWTHYE